MNACIPDVSSIGEGRDGYCVVKLAYSFGGHATRYLGRRAT